MALLLAAFLCLPLVNAAGTLTPVGSTQTPIQIRQHQVRVVINNGFARTEVVQTFFNPNAADCEAVYAFPVPKSASLSEVTIRTGEKVLQGEVLPKAAADTVYAEEKKAGNDVGHAQKNSYQTYEFRVAPVRAQSEVTLRFQYYQPLEIDAGVGRYLYPLEDGGTDDMARNFWTAQTQVEGQLDIGVELKSAWPVSDVRVPGFDQTSSRKLAEGHWEVSLVRTGAKLDRDFVLYYRLADNLPGRMELIPYRASKDQPGTFMLIVTPGVDLQPLRQGADYSLVLDVSGSMQAKLATLARGVAQTIGSLKPEDRFRIVTFNQSAREVVGWTPATTQNVAQAIETVKALRSGGSTNLFEGVRLGLTGLDADRATSIVLVTDGVTNTGIVSPARFHELLKQYDVRVFGFLMGNSANWPLLRTIADASGGFYTPISNDDDIVGQLLLAKGKVTHEALHDASCKFGGSVRVHDTTGDVVRKIYRGQQLVLFGRYDNPGNATITLHAKLTGEDKTYTVNTVLPEIDASNPEIERLWALAMIEQIEAKEAIGALPASETKGMIEELGVKYQLVTDHTSMVVLDDASFARRGIERRNQARTLVEQQAQAARTLQPIANHRIDQAQPAFPSKANHVSHGGGAIGVDLGNALVFALLIAASILGSNCMAANPGVDTVRPATSASAAVSPAPAEKRVGIYDSRSIACAWAGSAMHQKKLATLRSAHRDAKARGDEALASRLEKQGRDSQVRMHQQGFSTAPVDEYLAEIPDTVRHIMEERRLVAIVSKWDESALNRHPNAVREDVTMALVDAFKPNERQRRYALEVQKHKPISMEQATAIRD